MARKYQAWDQSKTKSAAKFKNCVSEPMLDGKDHERTINKIAPPELHLHLGIVNRLVEVLNERWVILTTNEDNFYKW